MLQHAYATAWATSKAVTIAACYCMVLELLLSAEKRHELPATGLHDRREARSLREIIWPGGRKRAPPTDQGGVDHSSAPKRSDMIPQPSDRPEERDGAGPRPVALDPCRAGRPCRPAP